MSEHSSPTGNRQLCTKPRPWGVRGAANSAPREAPPDGFPDLPQFEPMGVTLSDFAGWISFRRLSAPSTSLIAQSM